MSDQDNDMPEDVNDGAEGGTAGPDDVAARREAGLKSGKASARRKYNSEYMSAGQIMIAFTNHRRKGGTPRTYADNFKLGDNEKLIEIGYLSYLFGKCEAEDDQAGKLRIKTYVENEPELAAQLAAFNALNPFDQAMIEKKAKLLVGRMYARNSESGLSESKLRKFINELKDEVGTVETGRAQDANGNMVPVYDLPLQLEREVIKFAACKDILDPKNIQEFRSKINDVIAQIPDYNSPEEKHKDRKQRIDNSFEDVFTLIEKNRKRSKKGKKLDSETLLKEIIGDDQAFVFHMGSGFLIRNEDGNFTCVGGTREEWGQMAMMAMKYLQDRGDPWRGMVEIDGSPEFKNYLRAVFRQNSIRMRETGHTETFLISEIKMDVIGNYLFNHGRGYIVVRNIKTDEQGNVVYRKDRYGNILQVIPTGPDGKPVDGAVPIPVPEVTETLIWDHEKAREAETPFPHTYVKNFDVKHSRYKGKIQYPGASAACVANPYASMSGSGGGDYCLAGTYIPQDPTTKQVIESRQYESRLHSIDEMKDMNGNFLTKESFAMLCMGARAYDTNMMIEAIGHNPSEAEVQKYMFAQMLKNDGLSAEHQKELRGAPGFNRPPQPPTGFTGNHQDARYHNYIVPGLAMNVDMNGNPIGPANNNMPMMPGMQQPAAGGFNASP